MFSKKTLLITGGTGTFGNAVLRRFLSTSVGEIRVFSRDEKKQDDMRKEYAIPSCVSTLATCAIQTACAMPWKAWTSCSTPPR